MKQLYLILSLAFTVFGFSQVSVSPQYNYLLLTDDSGIKNHGIGINFEVPQGKVNLIEGGVHYYFKHLGETQTTAATAFSSSTIPSTAVVQYSYDYSFAFIHGGAKRFLVGNPDDGFGLFGLGEIGLLYNQIHFNASDYNTAKYDGPVDGDIEQVYNFVMTFGGGFEKQIGKKYFFADFRVIINANNRIGITSQYSIPTSINFSAGLRFPSKD